MTYFFELCLFSGEKIFLNSSDVEVIYNDVKYLPNSGLRLEYLKSEEIFTEILIKGFFEENGISRSTILDNSIIKVSIIREELNLLCSLEYNSIRSDFHSFEISYVSKSIYLKKTLLSRISKNCRASLGDRRCSLDIALFTEKSKILSIDKNKIIIYKSLRPSGYYNEGKLVCANNISYDIISSNSNEIMVDEDLSHLKGSEVTLVPNCDKKFSTCIRKFDNAVNFRGEPFIGDNYEE